MVAPAAILVDKARRPLWRRVGLAVAVISFLLSLTADDIRLTNDNNAAGRQVSGASTIIASKSRFTYQVVPADVWRAQTLRLSHFEPEFLSLYEKCRNHTMTSWERLYAIYKSVHLSLGRTDRTLFLYEHSKE